MFNHLLFVIKYLKYRPISCCTNRFSLNDTNLWHRTPIKEVLKHKKLLQVETSKFNLYAAKQLSDCKSIPSSLKADKVNISKQLQQQKASFELKCSLQLFQLESCFEKAFIQKERMFILLAVAQILY